MRDNRSPFSNAKRFATGLEGNCKPAFHVWEFRNRGRTLVGRFDDEHCLCSVNCGAPKGRVAVATYIVGQFQSSVSLVRPACSKRYFLLALEGGFITGAAVIGCSRDVMHPSRYLLASFGQIGASLATQSLTAFFECSSLIVAIVPVQLTAGSNPLFTSDILWSSRLL